MNIPANRVSFAWLAGGRTHLVHVPPLGVIAFIVVAVLAIGWSLASASYLMFKDEVLLRVAHQQREVNRAYENRISELRSQMDRLTSRQLVDQDSVERKLDNLARRQVILETRQSVVNSLSEVLGSVASGTSVAPPPDAKSAPGKQSFLSGAALSVADIKQQARRSYSAALERVEASVNHVESHQTDILTRLDHAADQRVRSLRAVFADLGLVAPRGLSAPQQQVAAAGGPLVPLNEAKVGASLFENTAYRVQAASVEFDRLKSAIQRLPLRRPVPGEADLTSSFGPRVDPFTRSWAMHTGLDFRADTGDPVRATAGGKVIEAGHNGGYGNMVEVDHGNGLTTRYAHLSKIDVSEGQTVRSGQIVGHAGSTGRSTGPHLHYETRIDGDPVDPVKFIRAGSRVAKLLD